MQSQISGWNHLRQKNPQRKTWSSDRTRSRSSTGDDTEKSINGRALASARPFQQPPPCPQRESAVPHPPPSGGGNAPQGWPQRSPSSPAPAPSPATRPGQLRFQEDGHPSVWPVVRPPAHRWLAQQWSQNPQPSCYKSIVSGSPTRPGPRFSITSCCLIH